MALQDIETLQDELKHKLRSAEELHARVEKEDRLISPEEKKLVDAWLAEIEEIKAQIAKVKEHEAQILKVKETALEARRAVNPGPAPTQPQNLPAAPQARVDTPAFMLRHGKLKAFKADTQSQAEMNAYRSGQWLMATMFGSAKAHRWCKDNGVYNALSEGTNTAGGNLVPEELLQSIIDLRETYGVFRQNCGRQPMGSDTMTIPRRMTGVTATFVGENTALTESDPAWDNVSLTAKKLGVLTRMSTEVSEDAIINLADWLASEFAYAFALKEDQCGFIGDGTSTYGGIVGVVQKFSTNNASVGTALAGSVDIAGVTHNLFSEIDVTDLTSFMGKLPQYARMNAKWYCSAYAKDVVFSRLMATAGGNSTMTLGGKVVDSFLGSEIVVSQVMPAGASTDYNNLCMLLYGDLSKAATLGERRGVTVKLSEDRYFVEDQIAVKATERIDIVVHDVGDTTNAGPIIGLIGSSS